MPFFHFFPHPFDVKSTWEPPIQQSVALESYLEEVKSDLADVNSQSLKIIYHPRSARLSKPLSVTAELILKRQIREQPLL